MAAETGHFLANSQPVTDAFSATDGYCIIQIPSLFHFTSIIYCNP